MAAKAAFYLKGNLLGGCNCDWGCPCNFEARPTQGFCEGDYVWHVEHGHYDGVGLDGLSFAWFGHAPGAVHEGNLTSFYCLSDRAEARQRAALETMLVKDPDAIPFAVFMSLTRHFHGVRYAPIELALNGVRSRVRIPGLFELELTPVKNPVTGEEEPATLLKPKGFTSKQSELCTTTVERLTSDVLSFDCSGKYGEFCPFEYQSA